MQRECITSLLLILGALLASFQSAHAWSSPASHTQSDIRTLVLAIQLYEQDAGRLPSADQYWVELEQEKVWAPRQPGMPLDRWGKPLVYRVPGKHGEFDVYSFGADGIDNDGERDDISSWAGVNDGFHWKATWPLGRFTIKLGIALGLGSLLLIRFLPWWLVVPFAGSISCIGVILGCNWLMHPGHFPDRNQSLGMISFFAGAALFGLVVVIVASLHGHGWQIKVGTRRQIAVPDHQAVTAAE